MWCPYLCPCLFCGHEHRCRHGSHNRRVSASVDTPTFKASILIGQCHFVLAWFCIIDFTWEQMFDDTYKSLLTRIWKHQFRRNWKLYVLGSVTFLLCGRDNQDMAKRLSTPPSDSEDLIFSTPYPQNGWGQFKACLWKQHLSYWRSPAYNLVRLSYLVLSSFIIGALFWKHGQEM